ncbi:MAG: shikimate dehydrogenase [Chloroflexi bacterium]|nr:shikimate dehydrogenase [Chloroflexota bacterium]
MKRYVPIIGYPLGHSISPVFQQAAFDHLGLDIEYEAWETDPLHLGEAVGQLRYERNLGANITIPYKEEVLNFLDELEETAADIGAVNTIVKEDSVLIGHNTDVTGFLRALEQDGQFEPRGKQAVVIGAGGAARAVCHALLSAGVVMITITNRSPERAEALADSLRQKIADRALSARVDVVPLEKKGAGPAFERASLLVNCTPMGLKHSRQEKASPLAADQIPGHLLVYDLVYNPVETPLLVEAAAAGARTLGGLPMLVYQGAAAFQLWTGKEAPLQVMFAAAREALA